MKSKLTIIVVAILACNQSFAQIQNDDVLHFSAGILSGAGGALIASEISNGDRFWTFAGAVAGSILAGSIKEAIDERNYNGWDNRDLGATILGGVTAGVTIDLLTSKRRKRKNSAYEETWNAIK
jgi:hypothetical protein